MKNCPTCHLTYPNEFTLCPHDGGTLESKEEWATGTVVREKYRILGPIGAGGMATVYKAEHIHFREVRALKVISSSLSGDDGFVRRFMQEAVLTRRLQHPNAVRVDDIDRGEDGRPFIVMEFIDGISLRDAMQPQVPMPVDRACRIAKQVASALGAAHALGMVHRDIKPANIFLAKTSSVDGEQAKVLDFGIAKVKESQLDDTRLRNLTMTGAGMVIGTPAYMSPEQAAGKRGDELDGRSDLYSLGVVLYQMLSGDLPLYAESDLQLLMAHLITEPVPIQQRVPDVPPVLAYLVMRCLAKEPSQRPNDAQAFVAELENFENSCDPHPSQVTLPAVGPLIAPALIKEPVPPTKPRYMVDYATADPNKKAPFLTPTKILALVLVLLGACALGAFGVITHLRSLEAAREAAAAVAPPVKLPPNPALATSPVPAIATPDDTTKAEEEADKQDDALPSKSTDGSDANQSASNPIEPPLVASTPASKNQPGKTVRTPAVKTAPVQTAQNASPQVTGSFPDPVAAPQPQKQMQATPSAETSANSPAESSGTGSPYGSAQPNTQPGSQPGQGKQPNDPWANYAGNENASPGGGANRPGGNDVLSPTVVSKTEPKYSQEAKSFRYSGTTVLSVVVDERGVPGNIQVVRAAGYGLDRQAVEAVSRWRFSPGLRNGVAVRAHIGVQVNFRYAGLFSFARSSVFR